MPNALALFFCEDFQSECGANQAELNQYLRFWVGWNSFICAAPGNSNVESDEWPVLFSKS